MIPVTATPSNLTKELFGESKFQFGLGEYLASGYAPNVEYHLVTNSSATPEQIAELSMLVDQAKAMEYSREKKKLVVKIAEKFESMMASFPDNRTLVDDLFQRAGDP